MQKLQLQLPAKYNNLRMNIKFAYLSLYTLIMFIHHVIYLKPVSDTLIPFLLPIGGIILIFDMLSGKIEWKKMPIIFAVCFLVSYLITSLINGRDVMGNLRTTCWSAVQLLVAGSMCQDIGWERLKQYLKVYCTVLSTLFLPMSAISMYYFAIQKDLEVTYDGEIFRRGWRENRLFGIYEDPNHAAWFALATIIMCIWLLKQTDKKPLKALYICNICIQAIYFLCTNSRGGLVALFAGVMVFGLVKALDPANRTVKKRLIKTVGFVVLVLALIVPVRYVAMKALSLVPYSVTVLSRITSSHNQQGGDPSGDDVEPPDVDRKPYSGVDISTNRVPRWIVGIKTMFEVNPLFGIGDRNITSYVKEYHPGECPAVETGTGAVHGSVAKLLTSSGVIGTALMIAYLIGYAVIVLKTVCSSSLDKEKRFLLELTATAVGACFASSIFLEEVFLVNNSISCVVFYGAIAVGLYICSTAKHTELQSAV